MVKLASSIIVRQCVESEKHIYLGINSTVYMPVLRWMHISHASHVRIHIQQKRFGKKRHKDEENRSRKYNGAADGNENWQEWK